MKTEEAAEINTVCSIGSSLCSVSLEPCLPPSLLSSLHCLSHSQSSLIPPNSLSLGFQHFLLCSPIFNQLKRQIFLLLRLSNGLLPIKGRHSAIGRTGAFPGQGRSRYEEKPILSSLCFLLFLFLCAISFYFSFVFLSERRWYWR
jgi:hypothetical protein